MQRIVAIGDSLIYGAHDHSGGGWIGRLRNSLEKEHKWNVVFNLGIGGETSETLLARFEREVLFRRPDCIIIGIGTNDARRIRADNGVLLVPPEKFEENLNALLQIAKKISDRIILVSVMPVDETRTRPLAGHSDSFYLNSDLNNYLHVQRRCSIDLNCSFLDAWSVIERAQIDIYSDGLHLNESGHEILHNAAVKEFRY